jgi:hypothetical protein
MVMVTTCVVGAASADSTASGSSSSSSNSTRDPITVGSIEPSGALSTSV